MRSLGACLFFGILGLAACSGSSDSSIPSPNGSTTTSSPTLPTDACTELVRCADSAQPRIAAAICSNLDRDNTLNVNGTLDTGDDSFCVAAQPIDDIAASAEAGALGSDTSFENLSQPTTLGLSCARSRFSALGINNSLTLNITGDAVIIVDGDVHIAGPTTINVAPGATLDFVVRGDLEIDNTLTISGGTTWLGVGGSVHVAAPTNIHGWLYAPDSAIEADNTLVVDALLAASMKVDAPVTVTGALGLSGDGCTTP